MRQQILFLFLSKIKKYWNKNENIINFFNMSNLQNFCTKFLFDYRKIILKATAQEKK